MTSSGAWRAPGSCRATDGRDVLAELGAAAEVASRPRRHGVVSYLRKLVTEVLDRVGQFRDFDPRRHDALRVGAGVTDVDDIEIEA